MTELPVSQRQTCRSSDKKLAQQTRLVLCYCAHPPPLSYLLNIVDVLHTKHLRSTIIIIPRLADVQNTHVTVR